MGRVTVERTINKPLDKVWDVMGDFMRSPGPSIKVIPGKEGNPALKGVGAERTIKFGKSPSVVERLESINPPNSLTFSIVSGAPAVKSLLLKPEFISSGGVTKIKWSGAYTPKNPLISWLVVYVVKRNINMFLDELEKIK